MAVYDVYSHPEFRRYRAPVCSKATLFMICIYAITFVAPFLIVYRSDGLWITTWTTQEQADVKFKHKVIAILDIKDTLTSTPSYVAWSTYSQFNSIHQSSLRIPLIRSREEDTNRDGKFDKLIFDMEFPLLDTENVHRINLLLFFELKLRQLALVTFEGMAHVTSDSFLPGALYQTLGNLKIKQVQPLAHKGVDTRYNSSLVAEGSLFPSAYELDKLFQDYASRNLSTQFSNDYPVWKTGRANGENFKIHLTIGYPEENIKYHTGFWQMIKFALVQYIAILIIFAFICERLKLFVFSHQLLTTVTVKPYKNN